MTSAPERRRSYVDLVTNAALLSSVDLEEHLGSIVELELPSTCLPAFLHEATHHWCFFSPVGTTLSYLALRARRRALIGDAEGQGDTWDVADDLIRYRVGTSVLRPFAEGMALFAEFDALPSTSPLASDVMNSAVTCFLIGRSDLLVADGETVFDAPLIGLLHDMRHGRSANSRKTDLLLQPMATGPDDGYLPGYLLVKNLWLESGMRTTRLHDRDLLLNYLHAYVFGDYGLVAHLLDPNTSDIGAAARIAEYLLARLQRFPSAEHEANIDLLEQAIDLPHKQGYDEPVRESPNLGTDTELWELGKSRFSDIGRELDDEANANSKVRLRAARADQWRLAQRELLCLGRDRVDIGVAGDGWTTVRKDGRLIQGGRCTNEGLYGRSGEGALEAYLNPWRWGRYVAVAVTLDGVPALTWFRGEPGEIAREQFGGYRTDLDRIAAEDAMVLDFVVEYVEGEQYLLDIVDSHYLAENERVFPLIALAFVPDQKVAAAVEAMREDGFFGVLGDLELVRALAWLSLCAPSWGRDIRARFEEARDVHRCQVSFEDAVARIRRACEDAFGDPVVYETERGVFCRV